MFYNSGRNVFGASETFMNDREPYATLSNRINAFLIFFFINFIVIFIHVQIDSADT